MASDPDDNGEPGKGEHLREPEGLLSMIHEDLFAASLNLLEDPISGEKKKNMESGEMYMIIPYLRASVQVVSRS